MNSRIGALFDCARFAALLLVPALLPLPAAAADFQMHFGVIEGRGITRRIVQETTRSPLRQKSTGFIWGFSVISDTPGDYEGHFELRLPDSPRDIYASPAFQSQSSIEEEGKLITSKFRMINGIYWRSFQFDDGDPPGTWELAVHVNDRLLKIVRFEVRPE